MRAVTRTVVLALLGVAALAQVARGDARIDAKLRCQETYNASDLDAACEDGVDLASRMPDDLARAMEKCTRHHGGDARAACQRGVSLHSEVAAPRDTGRTSRFSYRWHQGSDAAAQVEVGGYDVRVGDAERAARECEREFAGSKNPPSCLSGLTIQPHTP